MPDSLTAVDQWNSRMPDHGPVYEETKKHLSYLLSDQTRKHLADLLSLDSWKIIEPCNAITASLFILIVAYFFWKIRGRYREHPFVSICLPILLAGGVGGTIYHALRQFPAMFYLDVVPIVLLVVMGSIYFWIRLRPKFWHVLILAGFIALSPLPFLFIVETHVAIVVHYMMLGVLVLVPIVIVMVRTNYRHSNLVKLAMVTFGFAILFRFLDPVSAPVLPGIGTHWLWHSFGAITTAVLAEYFYRLETEPIPRLGVACPRPSESIDQNSVFDSPAVG